MATEENNLHSFPLIFPVGAFFNVVPAVVPKLIRACWVLFLSLLSTYYFNRDARLPENFERVKTFAMRSTSSSLGLDLKLDP